MYFLIGTAPLCYLISEIVLMTQPAGHYLRYCVMHITATCFGHFMWPSSGHSQTEARKHMNVQCHRTTCLK
jgi:hypothetical protein